MRKSVVWIVLGGLLIGSFGCSIHSPKADLESQPEAVSEQPIMERDWAVLRLLYSRIPTTLNPHLANGFQDFEAARIVYEPLASYNAEGTLVPILAAEIPTGENQGVSEDGLTVTWKLRSGVTWSDGKPLTAADVVFTYEFASNPAVAAATADYYQDIKSVEAVDDQTVKITFKAPTPAWQLPFTGQNGLILPKHIFADYNGLDARQAPGNLKPVGTGPYRFITESDGRWLFAPNERYRKQRPAFKLVELQGGIAPYVAARDVLRTGEADFAHNLQLETDELGELSSGGAGTLITIYGSQVERIMLNLTDPNVATDTGEKSSLKHPHPFLSDRNVRQAIDYAIDRDAIATELYGDLGKPTGQLLVVPEQYVSDQISYEYDLDKAQALLDESGWKDTNDNGIRDKDGVEMRLKFQTSVNPVRQATQERVKENLEAIGIGVEIERVRVDDFFSADPEQLNSINHFYADLQEYATGSDTPDPTIYLSWWTCDEIATQANNWQKPNNARYCSEAYDALWQAAKRELDSAQRSVLFKQMDELLAKDIAVLPIIHRALANGMSNRLTGYQPTPWDASTWDIGEWRPKEMPTTNSDASSTPTTEPETDASTPTNTP